MSDLDFDHAPGLPEALPEGERLIWQGRPDWKTLALSAFRLREVAAYFALLAIWRAASALYAGGTAQAALTSVLWLLPLAVLGLSLLALLAFVSARTTIYSLTDKRVVMKIGMALPMTLNLPYRLIESASLGRHANGCGDIPLALKQGERGFGYAVLWPHAKPWHMRQPEPMLRALPDAERVARLLGEGLAAAHGVGISAETLVKPVAARPTPSVGAQPALAT